MRQKSRKDLNQTAIVKELRELGYDVDVVERPYDIVVSGDKEYDYILIDADSEHSEILTHACSVRVELKSEKGKLSESQVEYFEKQIHKGSIITAYNTEEIVSWFGR